MDETSNDDVFFVTSDVTYHAGSEIQIGTIDGEFTVVYCSIVGIFDVWTVANTKWELKNPSVEVVYYVTADILYWELISFIPPIPCGYSTYRIIVADPKILIPAFASQGIWTLNLVVCDDFANLGWEQKCVTVLTYQCTVGESSFWENLNAPLYITFGGLPVVGWGSFSIALPSLLLLSSPIWGILAFVLVMRYWFGGVRLGLRELSKAPINLSFRKKKKKNGGKKDV